jgi:predicted nucleic acid-binding protein
VIVLDASAVLEVLLQTEAAGPVTDRIFARDETLHAPHLVDVEVAQVLRRYSLGGEIDEERGREALADLADLPLERYPHGALLPRVWELRRNFTAYDAAYLALAEALDAPLVTCDGRLGRAARAVTTAEVEHFPSSGRFSSP